MSQFANACFQDATKCNYLFFCLHFFPSQTECRLDDYSLEQPLHKVHSNYFVRNFQRLLQHILVDNKIDLELVLYQGII